MYFPGLGQGDVANCTHRPTQLRFEMRTFLPWLWSSSWLIIVLLFITRLNLASLSWTCQWRYTVNDTSNKNNRNNDTHFWLIKKFSLLSAGRSQCNTSGVSKDGRMLKDTTAFNSPLLQWSCECVLHQMPPRCFMNVTQSIVREE